MAGKKLVSKAAQEAIDRALGQPRQRPSGQKKKKGKK